MRLALLATLAAALTASAQTISITPPVVTNVASNVVKVTFSQDWVGRLDFIAFVQVSTNGTEWRPMPIHSYTRTERVYMLTNQPAAMFRLQAYPVQQR